MGQIGKVISKYYHRSSPKMTTKQLTALLYLNVGQLETLFEMLVNSMDEIKPISYNKFGVEDLNRVKNEIVECQEKLKKYEFRCS